MKHSAMIVRLVVLSLLIEAISTSAIADDQVQLAQMCSQRMGPFTSQHAAQSQQQAYQAKGYSTSGVWGEGGVVSSWANRRYFFNLFYPC